MPFSSINHIKLEDKQKLTRLTLKSHQIISFPSVNAWTGLFSLKQAGCTLRGTLCAQLPACWRDASCTSFRSDPTCKPAPARLARIWSKLQTSECNIPIELVNFPYLCLLLKDELHLTFMCHGQLFQLETELTWPSTHSRKKLFSRQHLGKGKKILGGNIYLPVRSSLSGRCNLQLLLFVTASE